MKQLIVASDATKQMVVDYINASNEVCKYAQSIMAANLPALVTPPANYGDYANTLAKSKEDASVWMDEVVPDFNAIPTAFINFNSLIQSQLSEIQNALDQLQTDPGNQTAIQNIKDAIGKLIPETAGIQKTLSGLDSNISEYQGDIQPDATNLNQLTQQIATAEKADQAAIAQIQGVFNDLQSLVNERNKMVTLDTLSNFDMGIFLAVVGIAVGIAFSGAAGIIIGGIVGIGGAAYTTFDPVHTEPDFQQTLQDIQDEMNNVNAEIGMMNSTVGLLQQLSTTLTTLVDNSNDASEQIKTILSFWQRQESDLTALVGDIDQILSDADNPADIDQCLSDIANAQNSWSDVDDFMQQIQNITYTVTQINTNPQTQTQTQAQS